MPTNRLTTVRPEQQGCPRRRSGVSDQQNGTTAVQPSPGHSPYLYFARLPFAHISLGVYQNSTPLAERPNEEHSTFKKPRVPRNVAAAFENLQARLKGLHGQNQARASMSRNIRYRRIARAENY